VKKVIVGGAEILNAHISSIGTVQLSAGKLEFCASRTFQPTTRLCRVIKMRRFVHYQMVYCVHAAKKYSRKLSAKFYTLISCSHLHKKAKRHLIFLYCCKVTRLFCDTTSLFCTFRNLLQWSVTHVGNN